MVDRASVTTRLSQLHPYPAMVPNEVAVELTNRYVVKGTRMLDPFCGSGRLLTAAGGLPACRVGVDANPLACLITRAKLARADVEALGDVIRAIPQARRTFVGATPVEFHEQRRVEWFPPAVVAELSNIVSWINALGLCAEERVVAAAALSAAVRDASYVRRGGWKLHRLSAAARAQLSRSAWNCFEGRLRYCLSELAAQPVVSGQTQILVGDARRLAESLPPSIPNGAFDVVLTSPPYGDSRTTVQYGAASALCLEFVSRINGFEHLFASGRDIDATCLGGVGRSETSLKPDELTQCWAGGNGPRRRSVEAFLADYAQACRGIATCLRSGGLAVLIVGRRSVDGAPLKLDMFTTDQFRRLGFALLQSHSRPLKWKHMPDKINRYGASSSPQLRANGSTYTIAHEITLVFQKL